MGPLRGAGAGWLRRAPPAPGRFPLHQAIALGLAHGPAELLPVSSSGHITLIPWLAGWSYPELDPELRKSFEVALHAGTAAALLITERHEVVRAVRELDARRAALIALSFVPPAVAGYSLEHQIERRLGTPPTIAAGLLVGSATMAAADRFGGQERRREEAGALDGLLLGLAQACALMPGVSRNGATLAAARARGFNRADANILSRHCALPIILGAVALRLRPLLASEQPALAAEGDLGGDASGNVGPEPGRRADRAAPPTEQATTPPGDASPGPGRAADPAAPTEQPTTPPGDASPGPGRAADPAAPTEQPTTPPGDASPGPGRAADPAAPTEQPTTPPGDASPGPGRAADPAAPRGQLTAGALAAFASTLGSSWLIGQVERDRSLLPYAAYRTALAVVVIRRLRKNHADG